MTFRLRGKAATARQAAASVAATLESFDFSRVAVQNVSRHFGRRKALSQVAFTCDAGDIIGLLGPNGAGKSTLLSILATLLAPSMGRVEYGDRTSADAGADVRARIGLLAHDLFLYPELTARENLTFFGRLYGLDAVESRVARALDGAGLSARADDVVSGFSRGMRQRVALERALLHEPRLILLDEPFTGLDQASTERLLERFRERQQAGCLLIVATHDLEIVDGVLTRAVFLSNGRQVGGQAEGVDLKEQYRRLVSH